jgi:uncharacterized protein (TIGR02246 family)
MKFLRVPCAHGACRYSHRMHAPKQGGTPPGIDAVIGAWAHAWNRHDMRAAAALTDPDVDFVTVAGLWLRNRDEFLRHHDEIHRTHMRETTWTTLGHAVRTLCDDVALAHVEWTITGECDAEGTRRPPRSGVFTWVLTYTHPAWVIAAAHNTNLRADTSHRLPRRAP